MSAKLPKDITFESALKELEEISRKLEDGKHSLEESMNLYEKGVTLKEFCEKKLQEAEGKWMILRKKPGQETEAEVVRKDASDTDSKFQQSIFE